MEAEERKGRRTRAEARTTARSSAQQDWRCQSKRSPAPPLLASPPQGSVSKPHGAEPLIAPWQTSSLACEWSTKEALKLVLALSYSHAPQVHFEWHFPWVIGSLIWIMLMQRGEIEVQCKTIAPSISSAEWHGVICHVGDSGFPSGWYIWLCNKPYLFILHMKRTIDMTTLFSNIT